MPTCDALLRHFRKNRLLGGIGDCAPYLLCTLGIGYKMGRDYKQFGMHQIHLHIHRDLAVSPVTRGVPNLELDFCIHSSI